MNRKERTDVVLAAAQAGAFEDIWHSTWSGTVGGTDDEARETAEILVRATKLVESAPESLDEAIDWAWAAILWSAIRYGAHMSANEPVPTWFKSAVERRLSFVGEVGDRP